MNKSLVTNLISVAAAVLGGLLSIEWLTVAGMYATSGAITNWLAVHMLFERVPGLYGSGIIPARFEEFRAGIRELIMNQFFTAENVQRFIEAEVSNSQRALPVDRVVEAVDYDRLYQGLVDAVMGSSFGGMLGMFGGADALKPLREPFQAKVREEIVHFVESPALQAALASGLTDDSHTDQLMQNVDRIVSSRLDELTPAMVKQIVQDMIRRHLGWLVVWGGVFGGVIGLLTLLIPGS